jgi:hypothetical protein
MAGIATVLCLSFSPAVAEEEPARVPVFSSGDGSRGWVEISESGGRRKAVPMVEISGITARQAATAGETGQSLLAPRGGNEEKEPEKRQDFGEFLKRNRSLLIQESEEGVSLYNALGLLGKIREATSGKRDMPSIRGNPRGKTARSGETSIPGAAGASGLPSAD